jgi:hypothetical protein
MINLIIIFKNKWLVYIYDYTSVMLRMIVLGKFGTLMYMTKTLLIHPFLILNSKPSAYPEQILVPLSLSDITPAKTERK